MGVVRVTRRLRDEYTELPGLRLTAAQVQRLCSSDAWTTTSALRSLVSAGFLTITDDDQYARTDIVGGRLAPRSTFRPHATTITPTAWRRVLCLVDFEDTNRDVLSAGSTTALRYATTLAVTHRARVTALHVLSTSSQQTTSHATVAQQLCRSVPSEGLRQLIDVEVAAGSPDEELRRAATESHADVIVLGTGQSGGASMSHLRELARQAPCPVLVVHPSGRAAVA